jgi:hypothetical protein
VSEKTRMEMEAGKAALAKGAARAKVPKKPIQRRRQRDL